MRVEAQTDVRALRRIALLVRRAKEDGGTGCAELDKISRILDRLNGKIALGIPLPGEDLREIVSLARDISCPNGRNDRIHDAVITELRDLAGQLRL